MIDPKLHTNGNGARASNKAAEVKTPTTSTEAIDLTLDIKAVGEDGKPKHNVMVLTAYLESLEKSLAAVEPIEAKALAVNREIATRLASKAVKEHKIGGEVRRVRGVNGQAYSQLYSKTERKVKAAPPPPDLTEF